MGYGFKAIFSALAGLLTAAAFASAPVYGYEVVGSRPHDRTSFTEGLAFQDGHLLESGVVGASSALRRVSLANGRTLQRVDLPRGYIAEGVTVLGGRVYQLTLAQKTAFVYDLKTLRRLRTFRYTGEGWGLTNDGKSLIASDGTDVLRFRNPRTFAVAKTLHVTDGGQPVEGLNELEVVKGAVCANVFSGDRIACINPGSGRVRYWLDLADILPPEQRSDEQAVLNGIAYDAKRDRLFITGKLWPRLFEVRRGPRR